MTMSMDNQLLSTYSSIFVYLLLYLQGQLEL